MRLVGEEAESPWDNRGHFFAAAAEAMRRILVDNARRKQVVKRGGGARSDRGRSIGPRLDRKRVWWRAGFGRFGWT